MKGNMMMRIFKPIRVVGPPLLQLALITVLSLFLGGIYVGLYNGNPAFRQALPNTWWLWVLPCLPVVWLLCFMIGSITAFRIRNRLLEVTDIQRDQKKGSLQITIKLIHFPQLPIFEKNISARYQLRFTGGFPIVFKHQKVTYNEIGNSYTIMIEDKELLDYIRHYIYIYIKPRKHALYNCTYLIKFDSDSLLP